MQKRAQIGILIGGTVMVLLVIAALLLRKHAAPEPARLLPEADAILYINLAPLRAVTHFGEQPVQRDPSYQKFIDATGFVFERDLDRVAIAVMRMPDPNGPNGPRAFSEIFEGRVDIDRLQKYLRSQAQAQTQYAGRTIYELPSQGRNVRVSILGAHLVAVSNTPSPEQMHSMIDRYRTRWLLFSGSSMLRNYYSKVPLLSPVWAIARISAPLKNEGITAGGIQLPSLEGSTIVGSLRWTGAVHLKIEEFAPSEEAAAASASSVTALLAVVRAFGKSRPVDADPGLDALLNSARIKQSGKHAELTMTAPASLVKNLLNAHSPLRGAPGDD